MYYTNNFTPPGPLSGLSLPGEVQFSKDRKFPACIDQYALGSKNTNLWVLRGRWRILDEWKFRLQNVFECFYI